ncbi:MAG: sigma-54-dependent Fis family transcriptional regulator [Paludibacteraceae bacterium]|nr:sigma-54-dependent Fis family transcriptional regulator [Paludibacteraceae bacterium]
MTQQEILNIKQRYGIVGSSPALMHDIEVAVQVAKTNLSVLITGENGVGKDIFSRIIHDYSPRKHGPSLSVNCGAFPSGTINSELFGHVKGAYTDARSDRKGYFEEANGGTLFLDEVGELPLDTQAMLLRVLETGEYLRMGESTIRKTNVRVVAATNVDLPRAIKDGRFREDLYYRLCGVEIHVPALRERKDDIPLLFRKFVADFADQNAIPRISLTEDAKALLKNYYWGGNIRQLKNLAEQLCVISEEREINADMLRPYLKDNELNRAPAIFTGSERYPDEQMSERDMLYKVLNIMQHDIADLRKQLIILKAGHQDVVHEDNAIELAHFAHQPEPEVEETEAEEYHEEEAEPTTAPANSPTMEDIEKESIRRALMRNQGSRKRAAEDLHISERTLYRKIEKFGL